MLQHEYLVTKIGFDTAENEPCEVCPLSVARSPCTDPRGIPEEARPDVAEAP